MNHGMIKRQGFTLVELLLAMTFVSVLLLAIAMTIIQIGTIYNRGVTVKEVNQSARGVSEDFRYNIASSGTFSPEGDSFLKVMSGSTVIGGRLCLGRSTYIWNYGRGVAANERTRYDTVPTGSDGEVRLVRLTDPSKSYCAVRTDGSGRPLLTNIRTADNVSVQELLKSGGRNLALHNLAVYPNDVSDTTTGQRLYEVQYTIGAGAITAMNSDQTACLLPGDPNADLSFCVVQQFTLVIRTGNKVN